MNIVNYIIAIDIGTQGTKAGLFDRHLNCMATAFEQSVLISPSAGILWEEAEDIFQSVIHVIKQLMDFQTVKPSEIAVVSIDSQMAGIMGVGANGLASTYYDSWLDTRCAGQVASMKQRAGTLITEITGGPVSFTHGPKILWWKENHPELYNNTVRFVLPHAYTVGRMVGLAGEEFYFDYTCLSYSGFGDNQKKQWSKTLTDLFEVDIKKMARIVSPFEIIGEITGEYAALTGLLEGTPLVAGAGDTSASLFGLGIGKDGSLIDCAGTASVLGSVVSRYVPDTACSTMTMLRSPMDETWYPLAYINGGGLDIRWFRDLIGHTDYQTLEAEAESVSAGCEGLLCIPHFGGRVLPYDVTLKGSFTGVSWNHTRGHFYRALMESIGYEYAYYQDVLRSLFPELPFQELHCVGGGSNSSLFLQIKADILNSRVVSYETADTALIGSAAIGGKAVGLFDNCQDLIAGTRSERLCLQPTKEHGTVYENGKKAYLENMQCLSAFYAGRDLDKNYHYKWKG